MKAGLRLAMCMEDTENQFPSDTEGQFPSRDNWEELIRKINESPHDGGHVEKIELDVDFHKGVEDLFQNYDKTLRGLGDE